MFRTAVVGVGMMGQNHARVLSELSRLVGVCDPDLSAARAVAARFNVPSFKSHKELLKKELDAVVIATPTCTHKELALDFINAGKHVLVEKPMALELSEAREIADAAERQGVTLAVGHIERHNPAVKYARNAAHRGQFGKVISASAKRVSSYPGRISDVGVVIDLAIHDIDTIRYVTGYEVESVFATGGAQAAGKHEDFAEILLMLEGGASGVIEVNWLTPMKIRKLALTCSQRYVEVDYMNQTVDISSSTIMDYDPADLSQIPQEHDHRHITLKKQEPLKNELADFLDAVDKKRDPLVTGEDGIEALRIAQGALDSMKNKKVIEIRPI